MKLENIKKIVASLFALTALVLTVLALTGCREDDPPGTPSDSQSSTNSNQGDLAPTGVGGKTFNGRIGTTTTTWQIVFTGGATSGNYTYSENGQHLDSGVYTYTKTSPNTAMLTLADGTTLQLTYTGTHSGTYLISKSGETGTFSSN